MIREGQVFEVTDDDGYHHYPQGHFMALRDIKPEDVNALCSDDSDDASDVADLLVERGFAARLSIPCVATRSGSVRVVGSWNSVKDED